MSQDGYTLGLNDQGDGFLRGEGLGGDVADSGLRGEVFLEGFCVGGDVAMIDEEFGKVESGEKRMGSDFLEFWE